VQWAGDSSTSGLSITLVDAASTPCNSVNAGLVEVEVVVGVIALPVGGHGRGYWGLINVADRWSSSIVVGWVLLLAVLNPAHAWPVVGIDVKLAGATRHDGVDDEGDSRGTSSVQQEKCLFHTPNRYPIPWPFVLLCHSHTCLNSFDNEKQCLHPSLEGRGMWW